MRKWQCVRVVYQNGYVAPRFIVHIAEFTSVRLMVINVTRVTHDGQNIVIVITNTGVF